MNWQQWWRNTDRVMLVTVAVIILWGLIVIGSATMEFSEPSHRDLKDLPLYLRLRYLDYEYVLRQLIWIGCGLVAMFFFWYVPYEDLARYARQIYGLNIILLISVLLVGHEALGAQRWIRIGSFTFQPSEFAKLFIIICLAAFLAPRTGQLNRLRDLLPPFAYTAVPMLLILKQPDLGTSLVFIAIMFGMLFVAGARPALLAGIIACGLLAAGFVFYLHSQWHEADVQAERQLMNLKKTIDAGKATAQQEEEYRQLLAAYPAIKKRHENLHRFTLKEYQMNRLTIFLNPERDLTGSGYHVWQSRIAIGSGGLTGKGLLGGTQSHLTFLPIRHTDFIFSVVGEEFGFIGSVFLLLLFALFIGRGLRLLLLARDELGRLMAAGIVAMFAFHIFVNVGMTAGIMPVTGIPLPFFSYGGSNMVMNLAALGLLLNVYTRRRRPLF